MVVGLDLHADAVVHGVCHLAGHIPAPDQAVEAVLLAGEILFQLLRRPVHVAGADGFVGVLGVGLGLIAVGLFGAVGAAVPAGDKLPGGGDGLLGKAQRVGTHIGDEAHGALALNVHALVKLLGDGHGAPGGHGELAGSLLLHGGGGEGRRGTAVLVGALDGLDHKGLVLRLADNGIHILGGLQLRLLAAFAVIMGGKGDLLHVIAQEISVQRPVFLGLELLDLTVAVIHHAGGDRLDTAGGKTAAHLLPQQRAELIAHQTVQNAAGLLGIHQILVDLTGLADALLHHLLGDLVEGHALCLFLAQLQQVFQMPGNGFTLAVRVRCEIDDLRLVRRAAQIPDDLFLSLDGAVFRLKVVRDVHAKGAFGQVPQMTHAGLHRKALAQIFSDGFGLRGGLHDDQIFICHSYLHAPSLRRILYRSI